LPTNRQFGQGGQDLKLPLEGIRVTSIARLLPAAYCTRLLADLGAEIINVEAPPAGDPMRNKPDFFSAMNRGKRSLSLDLKSAAGQEVCQRLGRRSDVFVESFRPGVVDRLGVSYARLKELNPTLVYASISGFGQDGPYARRPGHDLVFQAVAGMLAAQIPAPGSAFTQPLVPTADLSSGMFAAIAILAALYQRREDRQGRYLDLSMADGLASWMSIWLTPGASLKGPDPLAGYGIFKARDGKYLALGVDQEAHFWRSLCRVLSHPELAELSFEQRTEQYTRLSQILAEAFAARDQAEWLQLLEQADVPVGPLYTRAAEVLNDPQLCARGMVHQTPDRGGEKARFGSPLPFKPEIEPDGPPALGQHNATILGSLGYSAGTIEEFRAKGII
jgi:crotonobetainyl-CoA:carnitine CoA-transferase CaiB-like acyl-CoA transferase